MSDILPAGKLPPDLLGRLLASIDSDPSVVVGPGVGRDAAAIRVGDRVLVLKTDPITFATDDIGWYLANVNANDIACLGARPRWLLVTALLPEHGTTATLVDQIFAGLRAACAELGVTLIGGHTEITTGLDRPILVGQMIGEAGAGELIDPRRATAGDAVILARGIAIEGTAILAREKTGVLRAYLDDAALARARDFLHAPGISVVAPARALRDALGSDLHALHDPTEGGLATGLRELAVAAGTGLRVDAGAITVYPETAAICDALDLDPLGLIASGALLAVVAPGATDAALAALGAVDVPAARVGELLPDPSRIVMQRQGKEYPLIEFAVDEIARVFARDGG